MAKGFTVIELILVLAIAGILITIAYPTYTHLIIKSRRTDAWTTLTLAQIALERCYAQNFAYNKLCDTLPSFPKTSAQGHYLITLSNLTATTYILTATAIGSQKQDTLCTQFTLDQVNNKTALSANGTIHRAC